MPTKLATAPAPGILDLAQHGGDVERAVDEPERASAHRRDQRHLVAVGELVVALDVLAVHGVEETRRLVAEPERGPDVLEAGDVLELETRRGRRARGARRRGER